MRLSLFACAVLGLAMGGPARAQAACEANVEDEKVGELTASYQLDARGVITNRIAIFVPVRDDGFGSQGDGFARPSLMMDYKLGEDSAITGPTTVSILQSRYAGPGGQTPTTNGISHKVTIGNADPLKWAVNEAGYSQGLARALRQSPGKPVTIEVVNSKDKILAAARFDLSKTGELQKMVADAKARADQRAADYARLVAEGKAGKSCPGG
jgi:hypothetical protein